MTQIILLSGKQGSGKTTLQKELVRVIHSRPKHRCHLVNFADPLYQIHNYAINLLKHLGITRDIVKDGPLLQLLGTEWGRKTIDENIWVKTLQNRIKLEGGLTARNFEKNIFIVGDCRFRNELEGIPEALRVRLECDIEIRKARCEAWRENDTHPSETDLDEYSVVPKKFDMLFNTGMVAAPTIAQLIVAQIDKNVWLEKREK